ncbi:hypothetical protein HK097_003392 [Rhizophlyctis rosea]|uniref:Uncharacterized protein n=1 Tax=Rhizophlyctis rosea TaxID=64517 RepID=A0AAD5X926_9FUNG|nr:hypothetical protein HK097_003392 [Rhizophlyctis rosea]
MTSQGPSITRILLAVASAAVGIATYLHLNKVITPALAHTVQTCTAVKDFSSPTLSPDVPKFYGLGLPVLDHFLCFITPFFQTALETPRQRLLSLPLFLIAIPTFAIFAIESSRSSARFFISWFALHSLIFQAVGISVTAPLLWFATWLLTYTGNRHFTTISSSVVGAIGVAITLTAAIVAGLLITFYSPSTTLPFDLSQTQLITAFNLAPILLPVLWVPVKYLTGGTPRRKSTALAGSELAQKLYGGLGILLIPAHIFFLYSTFAVVFGDGPGDRGEGWDKIYQIVFDPQDALQRATHFLVIDAAVLWATLAGWIALEEGRDSFFGLLSFTFKVGPAAGLCFVARIREQRIGREIAARIEEAKVKKAE